MAFVTVSNKGSDSYLVGAQQTMFGVKNTTLLTRVFEIAPGSEIGQRTTQISPERFKGASSPSKARVGLYDVQGNIDIQLDSSHLGFWLKNLTYDFMATTTALANGSVVAAATAFTAGTAFAPAVAAQPNAVIPAANAMTYPHVNAGKLEFVMAGYTGAGSLLIIGTDNLDRNIRETVAVPATAPQTVESEKVYKTITSITPLDFTANGTWVITAMPERFRHVLNISSTIPPGGMTLEAVKGTVPNTYDSVVIGSGAVNFGEVINLSMSILGRRGELFQNVTGGSAPTAVTTFSRPAGDVALDFETELILDGEQFEFDSVGLNIDHNLGPRRTRFGRRSAFGGNPISQGERSIGINANIPYDDDAAFRFSERVGDDIAATARYSSYPIGGYQSSVEFTCPQTTLVQIPDPGTPDGGEITQSLELAAYASSGNNDLTVTVINGETAANF